MVKYVKLIVESPERLNDVVSLARKFASDNFKKSTIYAWDTENSEDSYTVSFPAPTPFKPCGLFVGKLSGTDLICGVNDYICPNCRAKLFK